MNFLCDANITPKLTTWLRARGHEASHVYDLGLTTADDLSIVRYATTNDAILISKDRDFSGLSAGNAKILWVRLGNCSNRAMFERFEAALEQITAHFESGARLMELR